VESQGTCRGKGARRKQRGKSFLNTLSLILRTTYEVNSIFYKWGTESEKLLVQGFTASIYSARIRAPSPSSEPLIISWKIYKGRRARPVLPYNNYCWIMRKEDHTAWPQVSFIYWELTVPDKNLPSIILHHYTNFNTNIPVLGFVFLKSMSSIITKHSLKRIISVCEHRI
jgi:hypothetical protein